MGRGDEVKPISSAESLAGCFWGWSGGLQCTEYLRLCCGGLPRRCCAAQCHAVPDGFSEFWCLLRVRGHCSTTKSFHCSCSWIILTLQLYCNLHLNLNFNLNIIPSNHLNTPDDCLNSVRCPPTFSPGNPVSVPSQISPKISRLRQTALRSSAPRRYTRFRIHPLLQCHLAQVSRTGVAV